MYKHPENVHGWHIEFSTAAIDLLARVIASDSTAAELLWASYNTNKGYGFLVSRSELTSSRPAILAILEGVLRQSVRSKITKLAVACVECIKALVTSSLHFAEV